MWKPFPRKTYLLIFICLFSLFLLLIPSPVAAEEKEAYLLRLGGGLQSVFPEFGYSGIFNISKHSAIQGIFISTDSALIYGGKYIYRFMRRPTHNFYGYGMLGHFTFITPEELVSAPGTIYGIGLEFTTNDFIGNFKYHVEIGYSSVGSPWDSPEPGIIYGGGIHFYIF
jgi:hypothetical protein